MITFEQPLNERIRTFLRIEQLFQRLEYCLGGQSVWNTHYALTTLLEIADLAARGDLKSELMKELKRQVANLERLSTAPGVNRAQLQTIIDQHRKLIDTLHGLSGHPGSQMKNNEFLNSIKQRTAIPGGTCDFDLPAYHHWLSQPVEARHEFVRAWIKPFTTIHEAAGVVLSLIRESATPVKTRAAKGFYQQNLELGQPYQMIRISVPETSPHFPEISAGKHRFTVRFLQHTNLEARASQTHDNIDFELTCCSL